MSNQRNPSTLTFPENSQKTTDKQFTWEEVRALLDKESMRRAEYIATILEALKEKYGEEVMTIAAKAIYNIGYEKGKMRAELVKESKKENDLPSLAKLVSHEMAQLYLGNSVEVGEDQMTVRETYCPLPRRWKEMMLDDEEIIGYCRLFDQVDRGMAEGYNPEFVAELSGCWKLAETGFCQMVIRRKALTNKSK